MATLLTSSFNFSNGSAGSGLLPISLLPLPGDGNVLTRRKFGVQDIARTIVPRARQTRLPSVASKANRRRTAAQH